jgi:hypothetical protein
MNAQEEFSKSEKFWMNFKLYQLWRFIVLNIKVHTVAARASGSSPPPERSAIRRSRRADIWERLIV